MLLSERHRSNPDLRHFSVIPSQILFVQVQRLMICLQTCVAFETRDETKPHSGLPSFGLSLSLGTTEMRHTLQRSRKEMRRSRAMLTGALLGLGILAAGLSPTRAGTLELIISDGSTSYDILDQGPLDLNGALNQLASNSANGGLVFADFTIVGLSASTNNPGAGNPTGAVLSLSGEVQRTTGGGPVTLTITLTDTDYAMPAGGGLSLVSTASDSYTNSSGSHMFTSYINPSNTPGATDIGTGTLDYTLSGTGSNPTSGGIGKYTLTGLSVPAPYGLTSVTTITLAGRTGNSIPDVTFTGQTQVTAIPEPASLALMGTGIAFVVLIRYRRTLRRAR